MGSKMIEQGRILFERLSESLFGQGIGFFLFGAIAILVLQAGFSLLRYFRSRSESKGAERFEIVSINDNAKIFLTENRWKDLGIKPGRRKHVRITAFEHSEGNFSKGKSATKELGTRYNADRITDAQIEISKQTLAELFPADDYSPGQDVWLKIVTVELTGFAGYWNHPDPHTRFANRFAVRLSSLFLLVEIGFNLVQAIYF